MEGLLLAATVVVASSLALAGIAKAIDRAGAIEGAAALGVPDRWARVVGSALAPTELLLAALLFIAPAARLAAGVSLLLLLAFTILLVTNLARGSRPSCHCFGEISEEPIGPMSVVRNVALVAFCAMLVTSGPPPYLLAASPVAFMVVAAGLAWRRRVARTAPPSDVKGLAVGTAAPAFSLPGVDGATHSLASIIGDAAKVLLLFANTRCGPCHKLLPEVAGWAGDRLSVAVVMSGDVDPADLADWELPLLLCDDGGEVAKAYLARATPGALLVGADGRIASPIAAGAIAIRSLVGGAVGAGPGRELAAGVDAPPLQLPLAAGGHDVNLRAFAGRLTAVLFVRSDSDIGSLASILSDRPTGGANVLVVAVGTISDTKALPSDLPLVVDGDAMTARAFGVAGTPTAVLVDATGRVSSTAGGAPAIATMLARADALVRAATRARSDPRQH